MDFNNAILILIGDKTSHQTINDAHNDNETFILYFSASKNQSFERLFIKKIDNILVPHERIIWNSVNFETRKHQTVVKDFRFTDIRLHRNKIYIFHIFILIFFGLSSLQYFNTRTFN